MLLPAIAALSLAAAPADPFAGYLEAPFPPADGFDLPEPASGPVLAIGRGRVVEARPGAPPAGGRVVVEHLVYEGPDRRVIRSVYSGLSGVAVRAGQPVERRQRLGASREVALEIWAGAARPVRLEPSDFIARRRRLFVPQDEPTLVLVDAAAYRMRVLRGGKVVEDLEIGLGQGGGGKERRGDLKTPRGMYFVTLKSRGPFGGEYGRFYGGHWIKVSYPGPTDAERGVLQGLITEAQRRRIEEAWAARRPTDERTPLGGGIGFHGWAVEWEGPEARLSWGCVVLHNRDISRVFEALPVGAMVVVR